MNFPGIARVGRQIVLISLITFVNHIEDIRSRSPQRNVLAALAGSAMSEVFSGLSRWLLQDLAMT